MTKSGQNVDALNRLLAVHCRSLPMYLVDGTQWTNRGEVRFKTTLDEIVQDQRALSQRIADLITERGGTIEIPPYHIHFTDTHFLAVDHLLKRLYSGGVADLDTIERCLAELSGDPPAKALAQEALGAARAHLEALEELSRQTA